MHHIELYVSDLKASAQFWERFLGELGYTEFQKWDSGINWKKDGIYIVLVQTEERFLKPEYHRCRVGLNHLAFHAVSRGQVDEMTEKLLARGPCALQRPSSVCWRKHALRRIHRGPGSDKGRIGCSGF